MLSSSPGKTDRPISSYIGGISNSGFRGMSGRTPAWAAETIRPEHHENHHQQRFCRFLPRYIWQYGGTCLRASGDPVTLETTASRPKCCSLVKAETKLFAGYPNRSMLWIERLKCMAGPLMAMTGNSPRRRTKDHQGSTSFSHVEYAI